MQKWDRTDICKGDKDVKWNGLCIPILSLIIRNSELLWMLSPS